MKYRVPDDQQEVLPNLLGLTKPEEISMAEFEGFLKAEIVLSEELKPSTKFSISYILRIHQLALGHLYTFAGSLREVNMSRAGFPFPAAGYLPQAMQDFEKEILTRLPDTYTTRDELLADVARVHGELLYIHPFREGNGRTARLLANLMVRKQGYPGLDFNKVGKDEFRHYVLAVQKSGEKNYRLMEEFIKLVFPD